jgi:hypothetical protein
MSVRTLCSIEFRRPLVRKAGGNALDEADGAIRRSQEARTAP